MWWREQIVWIAIGGAGSMAACAKGVTEERVIPTATATGGDTTSSTDGGSGGAPPTAECAIDEDCDATNNEGCDEGRCAARCLVDEHCPVGTDCFLDYCTEPAGTPCDDDTDCGAPRCVYVDALAQPVPGYCSQNCHSYHPCPIGYACIDFDCYKE